jgi:hypothetical protein
VKVAIFFSGQGRVFVGARSDVKRDRNKGRNLNPARLKEKEKQIWSKRI